jgi:hypothetical protein
MTPQKSPEFSERENSKLIAFTSIKRNKNRMKILPVIVYLLYIDIEDNLLVYFLHNNTHENITRF